jgi:hypothetical protein
LLPALLTSRSQDDDKLLGRNDLQMAADALGSTEPRAAHSSGQRQPPGQRRDGGTSAPGIPNPFAAVFRELDAMRIQACSAFALMTGYAAAC